MTRETFCIYQIPLLENIFFVQYTNPSNMRFVIRKRIPSHVARFGEDMSSSYLLNFKKQFKSGWWGGNLEVCTSSYRAWHWTCRKKEKKKSWPFCVGYVVDDKRTSVEKNSWPFYGDSRYFAQRRNSSDKQNQDLYNEWTFSRKRNTLESKVTNFMFNSYFLGKNTLESKILTLILNRRVRKNT